MLTTSPLAAQGWDCRSHGSRPSLSRLRMRRSAGRAGLRRPAVVLLPACRRGLEGQRAGVDAVALPGRGRPVVEDVAQVATAAAADHLGAAHEQAVVRPQLDRLGDRGLVEARPPGARVELGVRAEQLAAAAGAPVEAVGVVVDVLTGEGALGVGLAQHAVLQRGQLLAPLLVRLLDLADLGCAGTGMGLTHLSGSFLLVLHPLRPAPRRNDSAPPPAARRPAPAHGPGLASCQSGLTKPRCQSRLTDMEAGEPAAGPELDDPAVGLRAVGALHRLAEQVEARSVALARDRGWSWEQIGDALGVSRQSVHANYGK